MGWMLFMEYAQDQGLDFVGIACKQCINLNITKRLVIFWIYPSLGDQLMIVGSLHLKIGDTIYPLKNRYARIFIPDIDIGIMDLL